MPFLPFHDENPRRWTTTPYVGWALILICFVIFVWQVGLSPSAEVALFYQYGFIPADFFGYRAPAAALPIETTVFSTIFLHGNAWHLIGNMLFLYIFGDLVEDCCGHVRFALFFLLAGVVGALTHGLSSMDSGAPLIGASGAISGILGAYLVLRPTAKITALMPFFVPLKLPVWFWIGGWFAWQALASGGVFSGEENVAHWAHIGGFVAGVATIPLFKRPEAPLFDRAVY